MQQNITQNATQKIIWRINAKQAEWIKKADTETNRWSSQKNGRINWQKRWLAAWRHGVAKLRQPLPISTTTVTSGATGARDVVVVAGGCVVVVVGTVVVGMTATDMRLRRKIQQQQQQIKATRSFTKTTARQPDSPIARQQTTDEAKIKQRTQTNNIYVYMYKPRSHACFAVAIQYFFLDGEGA